MAKPPTFDVILTPTAERDLAELHAHLDTHSKRTADQFADGLVRHVEALNIFPNRGAKARERRTKGFDVRQIVYRGYRVLYTVLGPTVFILRVGHGARRTLKPFQ